MSSSALRSEVLSAACMSARNASSSSTMKVSVRSRLSLPTSKRLRVSSSSSSASTSFLARRTQSTISASSSASDSTQAPTSSTSSTSTSATSANLRASLLIHRSPLLSPSLSPLEKAYHAYSRSLQSALSNPVPLDFYFKKGSLAERRFIRAAWENDVKTFGGKIAGKEPDVGELPKEETFPLLERTDADKRDADVSVTESESAADLKKLERRGEGDLYLLVQDKTRGGKWGLPQAKSEDGEGLHESALRSAYASLGRDMDLWLVTRQPIGLIDGSSTTDKDEKTFIFKCHILAGAPAPEKDSSVSDWAWLRKKEVEAKLKEQGEEGVLTWENVKPLLN